MKKPKPPLNKRQFILSNDTPFGYRDYFLCEAKEINGKWQIKMYEGKEDIDIDDWIEYIKGLKVDFDTDKVTAYCRPDVDFRDWWKSIPKENRVEFFKTT